MKEMTAEDILNSEMSYLEFSDECKKRAATSCTDFVTDTRGFTATTAMLKDNTLVFFSVPFTEGFSCEVDGEKVDMIKADYGLMAVPVSGGVHQIRVTYEPEGFEQGLIMSIAGILILALCFAYTLKKVNKND